MAFMDDISNLSQGVLNKTKAFADVSRLNSDIAEEEKKLNNAYYQIGKLYATKHRNDCEEEFIGLLNTVSNSEKRILGFKEQISIIKGIVKCEKCGADVPNSATFCNVCGNKMPLTHFNSVVGSQKCRYCGSVIGDGMMFCTKCGKAVVTDSPVNNTGKKCPNCGAVCDNDTVFCASCGNNIQSQNSGNISPSVCKFCGSAVEADSVFCPECGKSLK